MVRIQVSLPDEDPNLLRHTAARSIPTRSTLGIAPNRSFISSIRVPGSSTAYAYTVPRHDNQGSFVHDIRVPLDQLAHGSQFPDDAHFDEANDARMRQTAHEDQFTEVFILRDEDSPLLVCQREECFIRGACKFVVGGNDVVTEVEQHPMQTS